MRTDGSEIYSTASLRELETIRVPAAPNAVMFMWAVLPQLHVCVALLESWGFAYRGVQYVWLKKQKRDTRKNAVGMGFYTMSNIELLLMGTRGDRFARLRPAGLRVDATRLGHSQKPDIVYELVLDFCRRRELGAPVEMFARTQHEGFLLDVGHQKRTFEDVTRAEDLAAAVKSRTRPGGDRTERRPKMKQRLRESLGCPFAPSDVRDVVLRPKRPYTCLLVLARRAFDLTRLDVHDALARDSVLVVQAFLGTVRDCVLAGEHAGFQYKTILFYMYADEDPRFSVFFLAFAKRGSRIKAIRKGKRSQIIDVSGLSPRERTRALVSALDDVFGENHRLAALEFDDEGEVELRRREN